MKSAKLLAQWENFKFEMVAWKKQVPQTLLQPCAEWQKPWRYQHSQHNRLDLTKVACAAKTYQDTYSELLMVAEAAWTMPLSNCWPERGGSAIKLIKTRMRSRLTDDMLNALMHVSISGPSIGTEECTDIVQRAAEIWLSAKNRRKPRSPKESKVFIILTQPCNITVHFFLNSDAVYCMVICSQQYSLNFAGAWSWVGQWNTCFRRREAEWQWKSRGCRWNWRPRGWCWCSHWRGQLHD